MAFLEFLVFGAFFALAFVEVYLLRKLFCRRRAAATSEHVYYGVPGPTGPGGYYVMKYYY